MSDPSLRGEPGRDDACAVLSPARPRRVAASLGDHKRFRAARTGRLNAAGQTARVWMEREEESAMNNEQFDGWLRSCAGRGSRRRVALGLAAFAAAGLVGIAPDRAAGAATGARKQRRGDPCRKKHDGAACDHNGQCLNGTCHRRPTCDSAGATCGEGQFDCCSGRCAIILGQSTGACALGPAAAKCRAAGDCQSGQCVGFRCQA
jgi:hypothetical protein